HLDPVTTGTHAPGGALLRRVAHAPVTCRQRDGSHNRKAGEQTRSHPVNLHRNHRCRTMPTSCSVWQGARRCRPAVSVPKWPPGRVGGEAVRADEIQDALDETPQRAEPTGHQGHHDLDDADPDVAEIEPVDAESADQDAEQTGDELALRVRVDL